MGALEVPRMAVRAIPEGYNTLSPFLTVKNAAGVMEFLKKAFGAVETERMEGPPGIVRHGEMKIGTSMVMLAEAGPTSAPSPASIYMYVEKVDEVYAAAIAAGAGSIMPPTNMPHGDRSGGVTDPAGNKWWIATHIEDVSPEETMRRMMGGR